MHSKNFEKVKRFYDAGLWDATRVENATTHPASNPWITPEECAEILGEGTEPDETV